MNSKSKITIIVLCQIGLIIGSFLSVAIWESQFSLLGNSVNVAGKNRLLTSQFEHEVHDHENTDLHSVDPEKRMNELENNILFLKNGGVQNNIELNPLDEQFDRDWQNMYDQFLVVKTNYEYLKQT